MVRSTPTIAGPLPTSRVASFFGSAGQVCDGTQRPD
jgi:hypothetical protein